MTRKNRHRFSKTVVLYALFVLTAITAVALWRAELTPGVITALVGVWGGELLLLCLKRVLGDKGAVADKPPSSEENNTI